MDRTPKRWASAQKTPKPVPPASTTTSATEAARALEVSPQTVRNWIRNGTLAGRKSNGTWRVEVRSVETRLAERPAKLSHALPPTEVQSRIDELASSVQRLLERDQAAERLLASTERERDRFRAEALAAREAALRVNAAARETDAAVRHLLDVLRQQSEALTQLLAPGSAEDLMK